MRTTGIKNYYEKNKMLKSKKHSAFTTINGINNIMGLYEYLITAIGEIEIVFQHNGRKGKITVVFTENY